MAISNSFPPDVPKAADDAAEQVGATVSTLRGKAADLADKATETVKDGYDRAKEAWDDAEPLEAVRDGGQAVVRSIERNPLAAFGLGVAGIGLVAWAVLRNQSSGWDRYQPDYSRWRSWLQDYGSEASDAGNRALKSSKGWLRSHRDDVDDYAGRAGDYAAMARDYADRGGRMLAKRAEREPMALVVGLGLAAYVIGSLLNSASASEPAAAPARKRAARR